MVKYDFATNKLRSLVLDASSRELQDLLPEYKQRVEAWLSKLLSFKSTDGNDLLAAMGYSVLNNGKRLRPALLYATGQALGVPIKHLDAAAASVELIHCYSLVHDDLPAMDDDDLRRGMPTCHKAYSEATAILTGDALQTLAFQILADPELNPLSPQQQVAMIGCLAKAAGPAGMVLGQAQDMAAEHKALSVDALTSLHSNKTGALFRACVEMAVIASNQNNDVKLTTALNNYAHNLGLAFQIQDDILDITSDDATLGKPVGSDQALGKSTFPSLLGLSGAQQHANDILDKAILCLDQIDRDTTILESLANILVKRQK